MVKKRVIPCLDVASGRVVKGVNFRNLREMGDPVELARRYSELGADELVFLDLTATLDGRGPNLDVISAVRDSFDVPVAAFHVSGEYAMVKAAAQLGWLDGDAVALEHLVSIKRAGADFVLTYLAREAAERLHA